MTSGAMHSCHFKCILILPLRLSDESVLSDLQIYCGPAITWDLSTALGDFRALRERSVTFQNDCSRNRAFREQSTAFSHDCFQTWSFGNVMAAGLRCFGFRTGCLCGGGQHSVTQCFTLQRVPKFRHPSRSKSLFHNKLASTRHNIPF